MFLHKVNKAHHDIRLYIYDIHILVAYHIFQHKEDSLPYNIFFYIDVDYNFSLKYISYHK